LKRFKRPGEIVIKVTALANPRADSS